jgi:hypothetical protein
MKLSPHFPQAFCCLQVYQGVGGTSVHLHLVMRSQLQRPQLIWQYPAATWRYPVVVVQQHSLDWEIGHGCSSAWVAAAIPRASWRLSQQRLPQAALLALLAPSGSSGVVLVM